MNGCRECRELSRRAFLARTGMGVGALALADPLLNLVATTYAQSSSGSGNLLVLCALDGGLDSLSFLAPFTNSAYSARRPQLALKAEDVTALPDNSSYGINKQFDFFSELYAAGQLAVVQQVGYPGANGSHFESQEIWKFGVRDLGNSDGTAMPWYERLRKSYFDTRFGVLDTRAIGDPQRYGYPDRTYREAAKNAFSRLAALSKRRSTMQSAVADTYKRIDEIGAQVRERTADFESVGGARGEFFRAAQLASAGLGTQVLKVSYGGFDTHGNQLEANAQLFTGLTAEFRQFVGDLQALGLWDRTTIVFYSEFGRRNEENGSPGTDHGYGGHMILAGPQVRGGLHGQNVTTADLNEDNLPSYVDFRAVFSDVIRDWLGFDPRPIFRIGGETYDERVGSELFR